MTLVDELVGVPAADGGSPPCRPVVAVGRTGRAIGQELFLSPRVVEMHIQHILTALDRGARAEAGRGRRAAGLLPWPRAVGRGRGWCRRSSDRSS